MVMTASSADANTLTLDVSGLTNVIDYNASASLNDSFRVTVKTLDDGTAIDISGATAIHGDDGAFTEAAYNTTGVSLTAATADATTPSKIITITAAGLFPTTEDYVATLTVVTGADDTQNFAVATVIKSTQNAVAVTAIVEPTLTMALTNTSIDFSTLTVGADNEAPTKTSVAFSTNATGGVVIAASAVGSDTGTTAGAIGVAGTTNTIPAVGTKALTAGAFAANSTGYFGIEIENLAQTIGATNIDAAFWTSTNATTADTTVNAISGATNIANSAAAPINGSFDVAYHAGVTAATQAGTYAGTVTYTATATF